MARRMQGHAPSAISAPRRARFSVLIEEEDGWYIVECPALPGCVSQGKTRDEAIMNIREAIEASLETRVKNHIPLLVGGDR